MKYIFIQLIGSYAVYQTARVQYFILSSPHCSKQQASIDPEQGAKGLLWKQQGEQYSRKKATFFKKKKLQIVLQ